jgi:hypothetical protein
VTHQKLLNTALLVGCVYEVASLTTKKVPTITTVLRKGARRHPFGKVVLWMWCGYVSWHFLEPWEDV